MENIILEIVADFREEKIGKWTAYSKSIYVSRHNEDMNCVFESFVTNL